MNTEKERKLCIEKCENILRIGGKSELTIVNYRCAWNKFFNYYNEETKLNKLKEEDLLDFFKKEYIDKNLASSTYNVAVCAIRLLYSLCFKKELNRNLLPSTKLKKRYPVIISKEEFIRIFNLEKRIKYKFWLILSFCSGLRAIDIAQLKVEYFDPKENKLKVLGKGNKERFTILPSIVITIGRLYCKSVRMTKKTGYIFEGNKDNEHINPRDITNYFCNIKKEFNINKEITEHSLRHSFATYYLMNGGDLLTLKEMLGNKSLATTCIYVHLAQDFKNLKGINYGKDRK